MINVKITFYSISPCGLGPVSVYADICQPLNIYPTAVSPHLYEITHIHHPAVKSGFAMCVYKARIFACTNRCKSFIAVSNTLQFYLYLLYYKPLLSILLHFIDIFTEAALKMEEVPTEIWQSALHQIEG